MAVGRDRTLDAALDPRATAASFSLEWLREAYASASISSLPPWVRSQAWKVLVGYLPPDPSAWRATLRHRRETYAELVEKMCADQIGQPEGASQSDALLNQAYKDLVHGARADPVFYEAQAPWAWEMQPRRHVLLTRLEMVSHEFALRAARERPTEGVQFVDRQWHSLLRILFVYAKVHPSVGYLPWMHELVHVISRTLFESWSNAVYADGADILGAGSMAATEADAFWCFSMLVGSLHEVYDFGHGPVSAMTMPTKLAPLPGSGMAQTLDRFQARLRVCDPTLATFLEAHKLDARNAPYVIQWLLSLFTSAFSSRSVALIWDQLLAQGDGLGLPTTSRKVGFLLNVGCAMLVHVRQPMLELQGKDTEKEGATLLQSYTKQDIPLILARAQTMAKEQPPARPPASATPAQTPRRMSTLQERLAATVHRSLQSPSHPVSHSVPTTPMPAALPTMPTPRSEPTSPDVSVQSEPGASPASSARAVLQRYTEALQASDAAASMARASTNLAAKALAWRDSAQRSSPVPSSPHPSLPSPVPDVLRDGPDLPIPAVSGHPRRSMIQASPPMRTTPDTSSEGVGADVKTSPSRFTLPSMREAARLGLVANAAYEPATPQKPPTSGAVGLSRRTPSGPRSGLRRPSNGSRARRISSESQSPRGLGGAEPLSPPMADSASDREVHRPRLDRPLPSPPRELP